ncbi:MAG TPA: hypothetical protein VJ529_00685 [Candidatus Bathyarchaeia archaeon]|nr:hypothetical protein [Candidatus Bathyarchaeia archaeon]
MLDVATLLHNLLFAYQKSVNTVLGSGSEIFTHPTLRTLLSIEDRTKLKLVNSRTLEEAMANFSRFLANARLVKECDFKKVGEGYSFKVDGCIWARHIHNELKPADVACPYALIAMALYHKFVGQVPRTAASTYFPEGTETPIEPLTL